VEEYFSKGQKGSSSMPHKRNPITCERIAGLSRVLRGNALAAMENVALWHERDITHSSVERVIIPDSCILLDYMLTQFTKIIEQLLVYPDRMQANINRTHGLIFSQEVLLALTKKGLKREDAYRIVQEEAMNVWKNGQDFRELLAQREEVTRHFSKVELDELFDPKRNLKHVDYIFENVGLGK
jgi:adenylosuccinate lyase